jgi:hypothetical protein
MKKIITFAALSAALVVPVAAIAETTTTDKSNASKECKALLKAEGQSNFNHAWGAHGKGKAFGKCVSSTARAEARQRQAAHSNAAKQCKTEQAQSDADFSAAHNGQTFAQFYGAKNANSAYGKCVSANAKKNKADADQKDQDKVNAARFCRGEQTKDKAAFDQAYSNFGACVSKKAHELNAQREQERQQEQQQTTTQTQPQA